MFAPNLASREEPLRTAIEASVGPVVVENDANAAAWAEARFGAGRRSVGRFRSPQTSTTTLPAQRSPIHRSGKSM